MTTAAIQGVIESCFARGVVAARPKWSLTEGLPRKLDPVNHVLRVILQLGRLAEYAAEFAALAACQHADGGWGDSTGEAESGVRNTCFAARNLIRANRRLGRADWAEGVLWAVELVLGRQSEEGFWPDRRWGNRDATSSSMGLLLYSLEERFGGRTEEIHGRARVCLARAAAWLERTQEADGSWHDESAYEAPVGPTSHLLPKMVLWRGEPTPTVARAIDYLALSQGEDGSWDGQHVDHTCDAARALLLTESVLALPRLLPVVDAAVGWLRENANPDGLWGSRPGKATSLIMTCDVLDCLSKYEARRRDVDLRTFWR
ncbi:MAG: terpene cyclase/mutase family protein [Acidobacteriota bacterium]|nr:terpene cyclase/mutase family protein [Acidobacteriota bacterium]